MSISVESAEQAEALVNTLQIEGASLTDANLTGLSSSDLEQLADLQAELECINASDIETGVEGIEVKQMLDDDIVETEIGEQEVEIEAEEELEEPASPDEILPDFKEQSESVIKYDGSSVAPPPLRPLTIAPKPVTPKVPMALKTAAVVNAGSGQQIVLIQSPGYNRSLALSPPLHPFPYCIPNGTKISGTTNTVNIGGQPIKLVSAQGQPVTIPNLQNVQLANKSGGMVQLRAVSKSSIINQTTDTATVGQAQIKNISGAIKKIVPQNKNIVAKVIVGGQQGQVVLTSQGNETVQPQQIKLVSSMASGTIPASAKTITLAQAQQMGLITSGKVQQLIPQSPSKQTMVVNKPIQAKTIKVLPQVKSPTKILPAPIQGQKLQTKQGLQRVIIKQGGQLKAGTMVAGGMNQVIRIPASQGISAGQIHQINVPGKGVQYIRFMTAASTAPSTTTTNTSSAVKAQTQTTSVQKAQVVPVAGITVNRTTVVNKSSGSTPTQNIIKVVPMNSTQARPVAPKPVTGQRLLIPATNSQTKSNQATIATIPASALSQIQGAILPSGNNVSQIVMLPAQYVQQIQNQSQTSTASVPTPKVAVTAKSVPQKTCLKISPTQIKEEIVPPAQESVSSPESTNYLRTLEPNGIRPRKPCNCTKSLCLKLYCDCFANGEFCHLCNCMNCFNNLEKEEERQRAIRNCLERNPNAFRPKIGKGKDAGESSVRKHTKGCNCKRSGCLKNYCECYEAKIACSSNCKCIGCRNIEDSMEKKNVRLATPLPEAAQLQVVPTAKSKLITPAPDVTNFRPMITNTGTKLPSTYMTNEVIEATNQCMIAQADEAERNMLSEELAKRQILEEFGRCLVQIIECSSNASGSNT